MPGFGEGTVRGTFELSVSQPVRAVRQLKQEYQDADMWARRLGEAGDRIGTRAQATKIRAYRSEIRGLRTDLRKAAEQAERLDLALVSLDRRTARPNIDVRGVEKALQKVELLHSRINALGRERATARVGVGGGGGGFFSGGGRGGRRGGAMFGTGGVNIAGSGLRTIAIAGAAALPVVQALTGAVGALAGSLGAAGAAAAGIGVGGGASLAVGLGSLVAVAKPAISRITDAYKATTQLRQAQQDQLTISKQNQAANDTVRTSQQRLTDANRQAKYAQEDLTRARRDARRELVDMALAQDRSRLSETRARLALRRARGEAARIALDPTASGLDRADARLAVREATFGVREARIERGRAVADNRRAQAGGVAGTQGVIGATRARQAAVRSVNDAKIGLRQATTEMSAGASAIATAKQQLDQAFARAPRGTRQLIADVRTLRRLWGADETATSRAGVDPNVAAAQANVVRGGRLGVNTLRQLTPTLGRIGRQSSRAALREGRGVSRFLTGRRTRGFLTVAGAEFDENLGPTRRAAQFVTETMMNIAIASRPFLREATTFIERWTRGWAVSTRDVDKTQSRLGKMVDHLKSWARLTGAAGKLTLDIGANAAGPGQSGVDRLTGTLNRWDAWIRRNPKQVEAFFQRTIDSAGKLAHAILQIAKAANRLATQLSPVLDRFSSLVGLAGSAGLLTPGAGALALGAYRGLRGGARGAAGAGGGAGGAVGAGAAAGGALGFMGRGRATYGISRALGGSRLTAGRAALPGLLGGGARAAGMGAGRAYLPIALALGALDAYGLQGRGAAQRAQAFGSSVTLGLIPHPLSGAGISDNVGRYVSRYTGQLSSGTTARGLRSDISTLRGGASRVRGVDLDFGSGAERERNIRDAQRQFKSALDERVAMLKDFRRQRRAILDESSRTRADQYVGEFQEGYRRRSRHVGAAAAFHSTVTGVLGQVGKMRPAGATSLAQQTLDWARQQARANPKLQSEYNRLASGIEKRLSHMGRNVSVVQGQILDGTKSQWNQIAESMRSAARRGVDDTSREFRRLRALALGALTQMGYTKADASMILKGLNAGGTQATHATNALNQGPNRLSSSGAASRRNVHRQGDGTGGPGTGRAGSTSANLMGANAGLAGYAAEGSRFGLSVSSGLRPGAITASGNRSLHADGWAIDEAGSASGMLRYAQYMAGHYGSGLDELIHTPLGFGIKNGKRVPLSFWGPTINADHKDHVHVGDRTPSGAGGGARGGVIGQPGAGTAGSVQSRASSLPGTVGALSTAAGAAYATAVNRRLAEVAGGSTGPNPPGGGGTTANQRLGQRMMLAHGWGADQWGSLKALWTGESNWLETAYNKSSGATGIPQALPGSKMASAGSDWKTNPRTQIAWGLDYIAGRYGSPAAAYQAWLGRSPHWYGKGGQGVYRGPTMIGVGDGQPSGGYERVTVSRERPSTRGRGRGRGSQVHLHFDLRGATITSEQHARELIERAADRAAAKLLDSLEDAVPESELVG